MKKQLYHFGVAQDAPFHAITLGGVTFTRKTAKVTLDENGETVRSFVDGHYTRLTLEQVERIKKAADEHFVRLVGNEEDEDAPPRALAAPIVFQLNPGGRRFRTQGPNDEPVGKWIYIEPASENPHGASARKPLVDGAPVPAPAEDVDALKRSASAAVEEARDVARAEGERRVAAEARIAELERQLADAAKPATAPDPTPATAGEPVAEAPGRGRRGK